MKQLTSSILFLLIPFLVNAQITDTIEVSYTKSAYILLKTAPKFDFGSEEIIVRNNEDRLIIQAVKENFTETNLFVQVDEMIYMFIIRYNENPKKFIYDYSSLENNVNFGSALNPVTMDYSVLEEKNKMTVDKARQDSILKPLCEKVLNKGVDYLNEGEINFGNLVWCSSIYTDDKYIFFKIRVDNSSNIPYDADYTTYTIHRMKDMIKKKAIDDYETQPVYVLNPFQTIGPKDKLVMVVAFEKFTIDKDKMLTTEVWEKGGDRRMKIDVSGRVILKSKLLSELK